MTIYIDDNYKCHIKDDGTMTEIQTHFFDGKCDKFIEGYRFVPAGESWIREDGTVFAGEMITSWKSYIELDVAQREYEREQFKAVRHENDELLTDLAAMIDIVYETDIGRIESDV